MLKSLKNWLFGAKKTPLQEALDERKREIESAKDTIELVDKLYGAVDKVIKKRLERVQTFGEDDIDEIGQDEIDFRNGRLKY